MAEEEHDRVDALSPLLVQGEIAAEDKDVDRAAQLLNQVADDPQGDTSLRWEAHNSLAKLYEAKNRPTAATQQYRAALNTLETARSSIRHEEFRLPFLANAIHLYDDYVRFLVNQGRIADALQIADFSRAQTLLEGLGVQPRHSSFRPTALNPQQVAHAAKGTILFYWLGSGGSFLWAITPERVQLFQLPSKTEIESLVWKYNQALVGPTNALETENPDGRRLYDVLIRPAQKMIPRDSRVFIIPDESLNHLNFETLLVSTPAPHYWIDDAVVTDANSLRLLSAPIPHATTRAAKLLLIGDSVAAGRQYGELPNAAVEMNAIAAHFPPAERTILRREHATPNAYLTANPETFSYIHFVAHGTASDLNPLDSAVVLSKAPPDESFKLYARHIIQHPLRARLVTISSCYGEGSRAYSGEGLVGLSWAFLRAGAHNVIGALWEVSDTSTPALMDHFYAELQTGVDPAVALRRAKLQMLHSTGVLRKPFYWAPFQLYSGL